MLCPTRRPRPSVLLLFVLLTTGCGDSSGVGKTYPVMGKITFKNEPWTAESTIILFKPDRSKGNQTPYEPVGSVDEQGAYTVTTKGKEGAPPGWYKVLVTASGNYEEHPKGKNRHPGPRSILPPKYGQETTTDLAIEVVEHPSPNAYDLKLSP
ncbi:MAG TPA: hypothetical protein VGX70_20860 [Gemmataceae bacterium]|nr:hypothetical protein [Gemmataceae bacterium]